MVLTLLFTVLSTDLQPPQVGGDSSVPDSSGDDSIETTPGVSNHNYTSCCIASNVSTGCIGFCNIQSILNGETGQDPENCETDFPAIVRCMAGNYSVSCVELVKRLWYLIEKFVVNLICCCVHSIFLQRVYIIKAFGIPSTLD